MNMIHKPWHGVAAWTSCSKAGIESILGYLNTLETTKINPEPKSEVLELKSSICGSALLVLSIPCWNSIISFKKTISLLNDFFRRFLCHHKVGTSPTQLVFTRETKNMVELSMILTLSATKTSLWAPKQRISNITLPNDFFRGYWCHHKADTSPTQPLFTPETKNMIELSMILTLSTIKTS